MKKNLTFTPEEVATSLAAVELLLESDNASVFGYQFAPAVKTSLCNSCLKKLKSYSTLSYFTKQEYTMIYYALQYSIQVSESNGLYHEAAYTAADKAGELAEA